MKYYFYCPKCGYQQELKELPHNTTIILRDEYARPIYRHKCSKCNNDNAGFMIEFQDDIEEKIYIRSIIGLYQDK